VLSGIVGVMFVVVVVLVY